MEKRDIMPLDVKKIFIKFLSALLLLNMINGCVSGKATGKDFIRPYQEKLVQTGPQVRTGTKGLEMIKPAADPQLPDLEEVRDETGGTRINLTLENAVIRSLARSPEIKVVSFDPSIAKENISVAASEFDVTAFGQLGYDKIDIFSNDISESGQSHSSLWEAGIKQKGITGAEWSLSYSLTRSFDESLSRRFSTAYEPTMTFELKQPLLRGAWSDINLAGVNISKLNYRIALAGFRKKAEDLSTQIISLYWSLLKARRDVEIQQGLLNKTIETLRKVQNRNHIDATVGDIKQTETAVKRREARLYEVQQQLADVQDKLVRLLADHQMNLIDDLEIIPSTAPDTGTTVLDRTELLKTALEKNSDIVRTELEAEVAEINLRVSKRQKMPRLDLVASTQLQGLSDSQGDAHDMIADRDFNSYTLGVTFEYPLGNREKKSRFRLRRLEHDKALSKVHNISDRVATQVKERIRSAETAYKEIQVYRDAVDAARIYLQALEDIELVRKKLTPEFLLTKLEAQDSLANAKRSEIKAIVDYNISLTRLAQVTGTVLNLWSINAIYKTEQAE